MFGITDYGAFVVAFWLFLMVPGPGNLVIATGTAQGGIRGGMAATLGVMAGDQVLIWCALGGVAALLHAYPMAFSGLQWVGAAYLAWLGIRMWRLRPQEAGAPERGLVHRVDAGAVGDHRAGAANGRIPRGIRAYRGWLNRLQIPL